MTSPSMDLIGLNRYALAANGLTVLRTISAPIITLMVLDRNPWWVTFWFGWFLGLTDLLDGRLARNATPTKLGAFLDPLADKAVVLGVGFALVSIDVFSIWPMLIIAAREVAITIYRSYWARQGLSIPARRSAKYKTLVQGTALSLAMCPPIENNVPWVADTMLWIAVVFTVVTMWQYLADGRESLRTGGSR